MLVNSKSSSVIPADFQPPKGLYIFKIKYKSKSFKIQICYILLCSYIQNTVALYRQICNLIRVLYIFITKYKNDIFERVAISKLFWTKIQIIYILLCAYIHDPVTYYIGEFAPSTDGSYIENFFKLLLGSITFSEYANIFRQAKIVNIHKYILTIWKQFANFWLF